ncbi:MAG: heme lyase CcmF/NrfE family subunit [Deltaproteobacteria bacterium]|nr:heme lyase CcmF/NrfE family subunit [Deltaproteobacteria bacterium]
MMSLIGRGLVLLGLFAAIFGIVVGLQAGARKSAVGLAWTRRAAYLFSFAMIAANVAMEVALFTHDFSVSYVSKVGSLTTPHWVTFVSLWSSLEGSILFWGAILGIYVALFTAVYRSRHHDYVAYALAVMMMVGAFFALILSAPADPFRPIFPVPTDGPGPNPLLQNHVLMALHPPMLYFGYVGMTVPFGIAMAAVLCGKLSEGWLKPLRRWTLLPWLALTIGIVLGGWWAYEVLGWGGYWAWDPVENASFLPWLAATGYLHSTVVQERRRVLKVWTLSLVILSFLLTMLGTFMTRSGVFNSVHAFSQSEIGPIFLCFIGTMILFSLGALFGRAHLLEPEGRFVAVVSRESAFLLNNLVLLIFTFTVLLGTVYPLVTEALRGVKVSVGEPYFDQMAVPLGLMLVFLMGIGPALPWGRSDGFRVLKSLTLPVTATLAVGLGGFAAGIHDLLPLATFALCAFTAVITLEELGAPIIRRVRLRKETPVVAAWRGLWASRRRAGGYLVHVAVIVVVAAIAASHAFKKQAEASLAPGQTLVLGDYTLVFDKVDAINDPNRTSVVARLRVSKNGHPEGAMAPALNFYNSQREPVGTPDVKTSALEDLYLSLMSFEQDGSRVAIKAFVNPMVAWIWWSLPLFVFGTLLSFWPERRRAAEKRTAAQAAT